MISSPNSPLFPYEQRRDRFHDQVCNDAVAFAGRVDTVRLIE